MGPHSTWFDYIPGYENLKHNLQVLFGREWQWEVFRETHFEITHVLVGLVVALFLVLGAARYAIGVRRMGDQAILPPQRLGIRALFEGLADMVFGLVSGVMGEKNARRYIPFLGTFFFFILFSNLASLIPGFRAPTDTLKTNLVLALLVFVATHILGFREHGLHYLEQFTGHLPLKGGLLILVPLMFMIELMSHLVRPVSLAIRLMANMFADHTVAGVFFGLIPFLLPLPFLFLGVFVSVVQAVVFTLMSTVYIGMAVAHEEH